MWLLAFVVLSFDLVISTSFNNESPENDTATAQDGIGYLLGRLLVDLANVHPISEVVLLLDPDETPAEQALEVLRFLSDQGISVLLAELSYLEQVSVQFPPDPCLGNVIKHMRIPRSKMAQTLLPALYQRRAVFAWTPSVRSLRRAYSLLDSTVQICPQHISKGLFSGDTGIYFYVGDNGDALEEVFSQGLSRLRTYRRVAAIKLHSNTTDPKALLYRLNILEPNSTSPALTSVYSPNGASIETEDQLFTSLVDLMGLRVTVSALPFSYFINGDKTNRDPTHVWDNHWGLEILLLDEISNRLNFSVSLHNPVDQTWSPIYANGSFGGIVGELSRSEADVGMGDMGLSYSRSMVVDYSKGFATEFFTMASPPQRPKAKTYAIFLPFAPSLWICSFLSVIVVGLALYAVARREEALQGRRYPPWNDLGEVFWQAYSHLIMQCHSDRMKFVKADGIRCVLCFWLVCGLLLTASYGGMLRSFLMRPLFEPPIRTLEDAVASRLPVHMAIYGSDLERTMAASNDDAVRRVWRDKVVDMRTSQKVLEDVYRGRLIYLGWSSDLLPEQKLEFTTPSGSPMVNVGTKPLIASPSYTVWYFAPFCPWKTAINRKLTRIVESGIISRWSDESLNHLKMISPGSLRPKSSPADDDSVPLSLGDFASAFLLLACGLAMALIAFVTGRRRAISLLPICPFNYLNA